MEKIKLSAEYSIEELEAIIAEAKKKSDWRSKLVNTENGKYLYIDVSGSQCYKVLEGSFSKRKNLFAFHSNQKDFAQLIAEKCTLMLEMHQFAYYNNDGWIPDWSTHRQDKFGIRHSTEIVFSQPTTEGFTVYHYNNRNSENATLHKNYFIFGISVKSRELAEKMLVEFGDRIKQLYNVQTA